MKLLELYQQLSEEVSPGYSAWKRKNVTLRGMIKSGKHNGFSASMGKGLYTATLNNKKMAGEYGEVYFVVGAMPKNPKIVPYRNDAENVIDDLIDAYCKKHGHRWDKPFFQRGTTIEAEMMALGFDGLIVKGREMVNYTPDMANVRYFRTEHELQRYYESLQP